ncbi:ABC transporter permease [Nocardioides sp.]|uniref:ABC transporter permease n=1 Tax=Nocardioides sp. TaxID=35761 RepID=UPI00351674EF
MNRSPRALPGRRALLDRPAPPNRPAPPGPVGVLGALGVVWLVLPLIPLLLWGATDRWSLRAPLPQDWGTDGWEQALRDGALAAAGRSLLLGAAVAAIAVPLGLAAGRVLAWGLTGSPRRLLTILLAPLLLPPVGIAMGLDVVILRIGVPAPVAVTAVLVLFALPYTTAVAATGYTRVTPQWHDQARALGASPRQAHRWVVRPAMRRSLLLATGLAFLVGWSDYAVTLLLGGGRTLTLPILLGASAAGTGNENTTAALALMTVLLPATGLTLTLAIRRLAATLSLRHAGAT